jgi:hypothetical protein
MQPQKLSLSTTSRRKFTIKMPKNYTKFNVSMKKEFQFLKPVPGSEFEVLCTLCDAKFSVADGGRTRIKQHMETKKHITGSRIITNNQSMTSFLADDPERILLQGKELAFAYHTGRHRISNRSADCNAKMISQCFDKKFTCGATKSAKLVQQVLKF